MSAENSLDKKSQNRPSLSESPKGRWCHTFLTEAGEHTDPFTLQYVAGHDTIKTTMRYVHPQEETVRKLFERLGALERPLVGMPRVGADGVAVPGA